jgi:hypothetical protein
MQQFGYTAPEFRSGEDRMVDAITDGHNIA